MNTPNFMMIFMAVMNESHGCKSESIFLNGGVGFFGHKLAQNTIANCSYVTVGHCSQAQIVIWLPSARNTV